MKTLILAALLGGAGLFAQAPNVRVNWIHTPVQPAPPAAPVTITYNVERAAVAGATTPCATATGWLKIASGLAAAVRSYDDTAPVGGNYCYAVFVTAAGAGYTTTDGARKTADAVRFIDLTPGFIGSPSSVTSSLIGALAKVTLEVDGKQLFATSVPITVAAPKAEAP